MLARGVHQDKDWDRLGMDAAEVADARALFKQRLRAVWNEATCMQQRKHTLKIDDVDLVMRQLRVFATTRVIWALYSETDENSDGTVDQEEFLLMVAKLRGRRPLSPKFYEATLPRKKKQAYMNVFKILDSDNDGFLDEEGVLLGTQQLNPHLTIEVEDIKDVLADLTCEHAPKYTMIDFLALQAKVQPPTPAVDAALLSLSDEERDKFERTFVEYRDSKGTAPMTAQEIHGLVVNLGFEPSIEHVTQIFDDMTLDRTQPLEINQFLYTMVVVGAGTVVKKRPIIHPGSTCLEAAKLDYPLEELRDLGYDDVEEMRRAGYTASEIQRNDLADLPKLRQLGYSANELRKGGSSAKDLVLAGYQIHELRGAGFSPEALREMRKQEPQLVSN